MQHARYQSFASLFLRLALAAGFLSACFDRFGWLGPNGAKGVAWGDWAHFSAYTHRLLPFLSAEIANIFGILATIGEVGFSILLIFGFMTRRAALGSGVLAFCFALAMTAALGIKTPLDFSVFVCSAGGFLLATLEKYPWSLDRLLGKD
jgi:putative oxidoreductase